MDWDTAIFLVEDGDELQARAESVEVLTQSGNPYVVGVLQLGDGSLGDIEPPGQLGLADRLVPAELVKADLLERVIAPRGEPSGRSGLRHDLVAELGELDVPSDQPFLSQFPEVLVIKVIGDRDGPLVPVIPLTRLVAAELTATSTFWWSSSQVGPPDSWAWLRWRSSSLT